MYFTDALRVLLRRWYVVLTGLLLIAAASGAAIVKVPTGYQASGQYLLLLPAHASGKQTPTNPFLNLPPGLTITASLIAGNLSTKDAKRSMVASGFKSDYAIGLSPDVGPMLMITADDTDPKAAVATRNELIRRLDAELARVQGEVEIPRDQVIHPITTSLSNGAEVVPGNKIKALATIAGAGMLVTLVATFGLDRFLLARRRKRNAAVADRPGSAPGARAPKSKGQGDKGPKPVKPPAAEPEEVTQIARARPRAR